MEYKKNQKSYLHQQDLMDHARNPHNYGLLKDYDFISDELNPSCGDSVVMCGLVQGSILHDVRFEGKGCMLSLAMASKLTQFVKNKPIEEILTFDQDLVTELLGIELGPNRIQCGMLSIIALRVGINSYKSQ